MTRAFRGKPPFLPLFFLSPEKGKTADLRRRSFHFYPAWMAAVFRVLPSPTASRSGIKKSIAITRFGYIPVLEKASDKIIENGKLKIENYFSVSFKFRFVGLSLVIDNGQLTMDNDPVSFKFRFIELFQIRKNQLSFRASAHTGVGISRNINCFLDCHTSLRTGSQ